MENIDTNVFEADYKGTCALCYGTVYPGHKMVRVKTKVFGEEYMRNVHAECQRLLIESSPPDLAATETEAIVSL